MENLQRKWFTGVVLTKREKGLLLLYSVFHFMVDLSTVYFVYIRILPSVFGAETTMWWIMLYNTLAFAVPLPFGILADKWNRNPLVAAVGLGLIFAGYCLQGGKFLPMLLIGSGNGIFHIGGGLDVLNMSQKKYTPGGCFISTGALGVFFGTFLGKKVFYIEKGILVFLAVGILILLVLNSKHRRENFLQNQPFQISFGKKEGGFVFFACFLVVVLRSYFGSILSYEWKKEFFWSLLFALAVMLGKLAGGMVADCWGTDKVIYSLGIAGILSLFSFGHPVMGILMVFLFNMTMPITLLMIAQIFSEAKGFSFGILMFALFLGVLPSSFQTESGFFCPVGLLTVSWISMVLLYFCWKKGQEHA